MKTLNSTWRCEILQISRDVSNSKYFPRSGVTLLQELLETARKQRYLEYKYYCALATFKL